MAEKVVKKMKRGENKILVGVCSGIAEYIKIDVTVVRLLWVIGTMFTGIVPGIIAYVIAAVIMPD